MVGASRSYNCSRDSMRRWTTGLVGAEGSGGHPDVGKSGGGRGGLLLITIQQISGGVHDAIHGLSLLVMVGDGFGLDSAIGGRAAGLGTKHGKDIHAW